MSELCNFYNTPLAKGRARFRSVQCMRSLFETPRYAKTNKPQDRCDQESPSGKDCQPGAEEEGKLIKSFMVAQHFCTIAIRKQSDVGIYYSRCLKGTTCPL